MTKKERIERQNLRKELTAINQDIDEIRPMLQNLRRNINTRLRKIRHWERQASAIERSLERSLQMRKTVLARLGLES